MANGVIVTSRYNATSERAESTGTVKNSDPASATATNASPPRLAAYARASVAKGVRGRARSSGPGEDAIDLGSEDEVVPGEPFGGVRRNVDDEPPPMDVKVRMMPLRLRDHPDANRS
jgi:hypothetical protein